MFVAFTGPMRDLSTENWIVQKLSSFIPNAML
jgi:hypothetical protein